MLFVTIVYYILFIVNCLLFQFRRTVGDVFRILPFSIFIIIPFMELLLPVYLWFFPNALPSTFQTKSSKVSCVNGHQPLLLSNYYLVYIFSLMF